MSISGLSRLRRRAGIGRNRRAVSQTAQVLTGDELDILPYKPIGPGYSNHFLKHFLWIGHVHQNGMRQGHIECVVGESVGHFGKICQALHFVQSAWIAVRKSAL